MPWQHGAVFVYDIVNGTTSVMCHSKELRTQINVVFFSIQVIQPAISHIIHQLHFIKDLRHSSYYWLSQTLHCLSSTDQNLQIQLLFPEDDHIPVGFTRGACYVTSCVPHYR